jgi:two-component system OmpR family response regulator
MTLRLRCAQARARRRHEIALSSGEFDLLSALSGKPGHVFTRDALMKPPSTATIAGPFDAPSTCRSSGCAGSSATIRSYPRIIKSVRGTGYVFAAKVERHA